MKISFIKKTYGKLQPFKHQDESFQKTANNKKLPLIVSNNSNNQMNINVNSKKENQLQIINKIGRNKSEIFANELIRKV